MKPFIHVLHNSETIPKSHDPGAHSISKKLGNGSKMKEQNTDIEFLVSAFAYPMVLLNETFYLRKRDFKVIGVHAFDHCLFSDDESEYDSGLTNEQEIDVKEAIMANEKNDGTHLLIPRLTTDQRFAIMKDFIQSKTDFQTLLLKNYETLIDSVENYGPDFFIKGVKAGVEMEYLVNGVDDDQLKSEWTEFYRDRTETIAVAWLKQQ